MDTKLPTLPAAILALRAEEDGEKKKEGATKERERTGRKAASPVKLLALGQKLSLLHFSVFLGGFFNLSLEIREDAVAARRLMSSIGKQIKCIIRLS